MQLRITASKNKMVASEWDRTSRVRPDATTASFGDRDESLTNAPSLKSANTVVNRDPNDVNLSSYLHRQDKCWNQESVVFMLGRSEP
jgi:hypothetical protein